MNSPTFSAHGPKKRYPVYGKTMKQNAFGALVELAHRENWCWNLSCTTCGHMHYRYSILEVAKGRHPDEPTWSVHNGAEIPKELGVLPKQEAFTTAIQRRILEIAASADLIALFQHCGTSFVLGSVGLVLNYCNAAESEGRIWSPVLTSTFRSILFGKNMEEERLEALLATERGYWTWQDLAPLELEL